MDFELFVRKTAKLLFCAIFLISCGNSENNLNFDFKDDISVNELLKQEEFSSLNIDEEYKDYITDFLENKLDIEVVARKGTKFIAEAKLSKAYGDHGNSISGAKSIASYTYSGFKTVGSLTIDGLQMMSLKNDKEKLYASFSSSKKKDADKFESIVSHIISKSANEYIFNKNVKEDDILQNYKSFKPVIKEDNDLYETLDDLTDKVDNLFILGFEIRVKENLNLALNPNLDFSALTDYGNKVITSQDGFDVSTSSTLLDNYFKLLNEISLEVSEMKKKKYPIPIEDWSDEKKNNLNFILDDISIKIKLDVEYLSSK